MKRYSSGLIVASTLLTLVGCSDDGTEDALKAQNRILQEQQEENNKPINIGTATVFGTVQNFLTRENVGDATARIQSAGQWSDAVSLENGAFRFENLPGNSDYAIEIISADDSFMTQVYFGKTEFSQDNATTYEDLGFVMVSPAFTQKIKVVDEDNNPITDIVFRSTSLYDYDERGPFEIDTRYVEYTSTQSAGNYQLTMPIQLHTDVVIDLDSDNDGVNDYELVFDDYTNGYNGHYYISAGDIHKVTFLQVRDIEVDYKAELRLSVLNNLESPTNAAAPVLVTPTNGEISATYDADTNQYVFSDVNLDKSLSRVFIPAFEDGDDRYSSAYLDIRVHSDEEGIYVYKSGRNSKSYDIETLPASVDLVIEPYIITKNAVVELLTYKAADALTGSDAVPQFFFSSAIELYDNSTEFWAENAFEVTPGNADDGDEVPAGTTRFSHTHKEIAYEAKLTLNDTLLSLDPTAALAKGFYEARLQNKVKDVYADDDINVGRYVDFMVRDTSKFDIQTQLVIDNNNYTTNGEVITDENTADVASTASDSSAYVYIYVPTNIAGLEVFKLTLTGYVRNGTQIEADQTFTLVNNGSVSSVRPVDTYATANNEIFTGYTNRTVVRGSSLSNDLMYRSYSDFAYLSDDTDENENNATFEYFIEYEDGSVDEGVITLPVK